MSDRLQRAAAGALLAALTLGLSACAGAPSALDGKGSESRHIAGAWWLMFGLATAVYVVVAGMILYAVVRGRRRRRRTTRISDDLFIWIGGIVVPALILLVLGVVTVTTSEAIRQPDSRALVIDVTGERWWWAVRYPDEGIVTANELHVPVGRPIEIRLRSDDVVHSFWAPELAGKVDAIPGQTNKLELTVEEPGRYRGVCAEYCGLQHAHMGFYVIAHTDGEYERWVARTRIDTPAPTSELEARGQLVFERASCAGCHTIRGTTAHGTAGPDLTHVGSRRTIGALAVENTEGNLAGWIADPDSIKTGVLMPPGLLSPDDLRAVVAYLQSRK